MLAFSDAMVIAFVIAKLNPFEVKYEVAVVFTT